MKILLQNIITPFYVDDDEIISVAQKKLMAQGINVCGAAAQIYKKSFDARRKNDIKSVCSVGVELPDNIAAERLADVLKKINGTLVNENQISFERGEEKLSSRPLVVGMGPAGLFCALMLAENGYAPIIIDRGPSVKDREKKVEHFYNERALDENANIQFGAGGAGTFSDGKLVTRINDDKCSYVLRKLYEYGAPEEILTKAKPHIGTDKLRTVVDSILEKIKTLGGDVMYDCKMIGFDRLPSGSFKVETSKGDIVAGTMVLAVGHSARDTVKMLMENNFKVEPKPFSVGVRIEHLRDDIDKALYGDFAGHKKLGAGEYNLSDTKGGRGVYTFCMCPGGEVVAATSELGGVVVNGMSRYARDGVNSNAALAVTVRCEDYGNTAAKAIAYQQSLEKAAFVAGGGNYNAPVQTVGDFLNGRASTMPKRIMPSYMGGDAFEIVRLDNLLPGYVSDALKRGICLFGKRMDGFDAFDAVLTGVETRTSSPIRLPRNSAYVSDNNNNIYPCGEGAGYAGGITSAAVDGINTAIEIMKRYAPFESLC